jgi:hypothetical protein
MKLLTKTTNPYSIVFHLIGIAAIIWFLVRVLPKPDRIRYPCQQISITFASGYIAFWGILWTVIFNGLAIWMRRAKHKTTAFAPVILVGIFLIFTITSGVYANTFVNNNEEIASWDPITNEPIGTPRGLNPGRVAWIWDPDATPSDLNGYWWKKENNNQEVIEDMFSTGLQSLIGIEDDEAAWDALFKHFNDMHGNGETGYQPGEKLAIKVNLNNCWQLFSYTKEDNERDASPYVVKALLRQLVNVVGVAQEDITVYDASRPMANWFYDRVYYEEYPASTLVPEFPNVHYKDSQGGATGRVIVQPSDERIYFADETGLYRTLPNCVADADYIINMPILKRHPIDMGVTFSGKNFFGTWVEGVPDVHNYHRAAFTEGNPTPQTDLLAHDHIGGKTILYFGDGTFATKVDHATIAKFQMEPFNNDWTNSLFFSQDPIAIDSVMYDFLYTEGCNPCEGSQNYLHQSAEPPNGVYDPENDGTFVSESLGVHEHWNESVDIFSSDRYLGLSGNGIDLVTIGEGANLAPIKPDKPQGPSLGVPETEYTFISKSTDPEGDQIFYKFSWGDGTDSGWLGPYASGEEIFDTHQWTSKGNYEVKVKAKDEHEKESTWSNPLSVTMPRDRVLIKPVIYRLFEKLQQFPILERLLGKIL